MKNIFKGFFVPICFVEPFKLKWYRKDAKRILSGKPWNSRKFRAIRLHTVFPIEDKNGYLKYWLLELIQDKTSGEIRVTPLYEVELLNQINQFDYRIKRK